MRTRKIPINSKNVRIVLSGCTPAAIWLHTSLAGKCKGGRGKGRKTRVSIYQSNLKEEKRMLWIYILLITFLICVYIDTTNSWWWLLLIEFCLSYLSDFIRITIQYTIRYLNIFPMNVNSMLFVLMQNNTYFISLRNWLMVEQCENRECNSTRYVVKWYMVQCTR